MALSSACPDPTLSSGDSCSVGTRSRRRASQAASALSTGVQYDPPLAFGRVTRRLGDRAAAAVFLVSLAFWWLEALVIPLGPGRDLGTYLGDYLQLFQSHAIDLGYVLGRTPVGLAATGGLSAADAAALQAVAATSIP